MYLDDGKSYLLFGKQINQIIMVLQMVSDKYPDIKNINRFIQNLKDMRAYEDMLDEFIFGDQKTYPDDKRPVGSKDADWSVPFIVLSNVKCLSIHLEPRATAADSIAPLPCL